MKIFSTLLLAACLQGSLTVAQETNLMLTNARTFIDAPYVARTLETDGEEYLVINCDEVDCLTFVENTLAMSLCDKQGKDMDEAEFSRNLQRIRYRDGIIDGYTSRLHYIADWINNGVRGGFLKDITEENSPYTQVLNVSFMSTHPGNYKHLANSPENVAKMAAYEKALTGQTIHWLPKDAVPVKGTPYIKNGDIIAIATNTPGLDVTHMGIAIYVKGNLCLMHASSSRGKVLVDKHVLNSLLTRNEHWTGIRVFRMNK